VQRGDSGSEPDLVFEFLPPIGDQHPEVMGLLHRLRSPDFFEKEMMEKEMMEKEMMRQDFTSMLHAALEKLERRPL